MSLTLLDSSFSEVSFFDSLGLVGDKTGNFFLFSNARGEEFSIEYIPEFFSDWNPDFFEIEFFENPYLTAENDIFEVKESNIDGRFGWIFPVAALDSNQNDYVNNKSFKHYRYIAYWKLLNRNIRVHLAPKQQYLISDIYPNLIIGIFSRLEIDKIPNYKIQDYALSFLKYDYLLYNDKFRGVRAFNKDVIIADIRNKKPNITIKKASYDILNNEYTKSLFVEHLYQTESYLVKYIFLYQILEYFIEELGEVKLNELLSSYQNGAISKNTFKEKINYLSSDRTLLRQIFEKTKMNNDLKNDFVLMCKQLFSSIGKDVSDNFEDILYDFRNLITHNYRTVTGKSIQVEEIVLLFEHIIFDLLINYNNRLNNQDDDIDAFGIKAHTQKENEAFKRWSTLVWARLAARGGF